MKSYLLKIFLIFFKILPDTRLYTLKNSLLRLLGFNIHQSARLVSSVKISGICELEVGKDTFIGHDVSFYGNGSFILGDNVDIAPQVKLLTGSHKIDQLPKRAAGTGYNSYIKIGNGTWVGAGSIILPGVTIGEGSIIAAGSVVNTDVESFSLYVGNPARFKKKLI